MNSGYKGRNPLVYKNSGVVDNACTSDDTSSMNNKIILDADKRSISVPVYADKIILAPQSGPVVLTLQRTRRFSVYSIAS